MRQTAPPRVAAWEMKPQNLSLKKPVGVEEAGETPSLTGEFVGDPQGPRTYTKPPTWETAPERAQSACGK